MSSITASYTGPADTRQFKAEISKSESSRGNLTAAISVIHKDLNGYFTQQMAIATQSAYVKEDGQDTQQDEEDQDEEDQGEDTEEQADSVAKGQSKKQKTC